MSINNGYSICMNTWALDKDIKNELGLLLIISGLCAKDGKCSASNDYFAELFQINPTLVSRKIKKLITKGYVFAEYKGQKGVCNERYLRLSKTIKTVIENDKNHLSKTIKTVIENDKNHLSKTIKTVIENDKDKSTSIKSTIGGKSSSFLLDDAIEYFKSKIEDQELAHDEAINFFHYYEANEWKRKGGVEIKNRKMAATGWISRMKKFIKKDEVKKPSISESVNNPKPFYASQGL